MTERTTDWVTDSVTQGITKSATEGVTGGVTERVTESVTDGITQGVTGSVLYPALRYAVPATPFVGHPRSSPQIGQVTQIPVRASGAILRV